MIKLKHIDLDGIEFSEQLEKVLEEEREFLIACIKGDKDHLKDEFCDCIVSKVGLLALLGISVNEIEEYYNNQHSKKLKNRLLKAREKINFSEFCNNKENCNNCNLNQYAETGICKDVYNALKNIKKCEKGGNYYERL